MVRYAWFLANRGWILTNKLKVEINLAPLKAKTTGMPQSVANLILSEPDEMDADEYFAKASVWFKALQSEQAGGRH